MLKVTESGCLLLSNAIFCLQPSWFENYPTFYRSPPCEKFKAFVQSPMFGYIVAFVLVVNLVAVIIETTVCLLIFLCILIYYLWFLFP